MQVIDILFILSIFKNLQAEQDVTTSFYLSFLIFIFENHDSQENLSKGQAPVSLTALGVWN